MRNAAPKSQQGVVLVLGLILLVILTIVGFSSMKVSGTQQKTATNHNNKALSIQAAEFGLSKVIEKMTTGTTKNCASAVACELEIYVAPAVQADSNLTLVPNTTNAFWVLNSEISKNSSTGVITVEILGAAKDSLSGTEAAVSVFKATFQSQVESASMWAGNKMEFLSTHSNSVINVSGDLKSYGDLLINPRTVTVSSGKYGGSLTCPNCSSSQLSLIQRETVSAPPTAQSLIPGAVNSTNCSNPASWTSNSTIICSSSVKFSNSVSRNLENFKMLVMNTIEIEKNFEIIGSGNLIASTNDIKFLSNGNQTHQGIFHANNTIDMTASSSAGVVITGALTARNDIKIDARTLTLNLPSAGSGGASSSATFKILSWQQIS